VASSSKQFLEYPFLDAIYESLRLQGGGAEGLLCARGASSRMAGKCCCTRRWAIRKATAAGWGTLRDLIRPGLRPPVGVTSDGALGLLRAIKETWPKSLRIRCWVHRMRNVLDKVPDADLAQLLRLRQELRLPLHRKCVLLKRNVALRSKKRMVA
jgi:putative transposase